MENVYSPPSRKLMKENHKQRYYQSLQKSINSKLQDILKESYDNPVVKARNTWQITSEMIQVILGPEVFEKWFKNIKPIVLKNKNLIVQTDSVFAAQWINTHYQELIDSIAKAQDKNLTCFFIGPKTWNKTNGKHHF